MFKINRRQVLAGSIAMLTARKARSAIPADTGRPVPLSEIRRIYVDQKDPACLWADTMRGDDLKAMQDLVVAIMGDVRRKPSWSMGWSIATTLAYQAIYKPFGYYRAESDFFAQRLGRTLVTRADMAGLQRLYTFAHAGCSTVMAWDGQAKRMVHFRSLDWPSASSIANATRVYNGVHDDGTVAFTAAGILGMVGLLTAVKPGFSVAINFAPWRGTSLSPNADPTFLVRQLMTSTINSYQDAVAAIKRWKPSAPVFISVCGIAKGEACIFEFGASWDKNGPYNLITMGERTHLIQTNHFDAQSPFVRHNPSQISLLEGASDWDDYSLLQTSVERKSMLDTALSTAYAAQEDFDLDKLLQDTFIRRPIWNHITAQWVSLTPQSGALRAWVRGEA